MPRPPSRDNHFGLLGTADRLRLSKALERDQDSLSELEQFCPTSVTLVVVPTKIGLRKFGQVDADRLLRHRRQVAPRLLSRMRDDRGHKTRERIVQSGEHKLRGLPVRSF